jgi:glycosyltransferase involved in cell wall biosynthesis
LCRIEKKHIKDLRRHRRAACPRFTMTKTIWLDVSTIHSWEGPLVGVVRTELEIVRNLLLEFKRGIRFCRYIPALGIHIEVSNVETAAIVQRLDMCAGASPSHSSAGLGSRLRDFSKRMIQYLPQGPQRILIRLVRWHKGSAVRIRRALIGLRHHCLGYFRLLPVGIEPKLVQDDIYISLGLDITGDVFSSVYAIKKETGIKVMGICHDIIPVLPHVVGSEYSYDFYRFIIGMARCADKILCNSHNTLYDLEEFLSAEKERRPSLDVIPWGACIGSTAGTIDSRVYGICRIPYILYVSTIDGVRKNHEILYHAYRKMVEGDQRNLPRLVFVGRPSRRAECLLSHIRLDQTMRELIIILDHVNDSELSCLYRNALFSVYPSRYEGWGLPVAESLANGKFCIVSSASSLPEVGGDFVEYVDPYDLHGWIERLTYYFNNRQALQEREARIRSEYRPPTWVETTRELVNHALNL